MLLIIDIFMIVLLKKLFDSIMKLVLCLSGVLGVWIMLWLVFCVVLVIVLIE